MNVLLSLKKYFYRHISDVSWQSIATFLLIYVVGCWCTLYAAGEHELVSSTNFVYWLMVTASTVGYGDFSPQTVAGKYVVSLFVIPFGLSLFGLIIGRLAAFGSQQWRKGLKGMRALNYKQHILIIGWNDIRTPYLLTLLLREIESGADKRKIALCVDVEMDNPLPDKIGFVSVASFSSDAEMDRAAVADADCIILDTGEDECTLTAALYASSRNSTGHMVAYFNDESLGALLKRHCPNVENMPSVAVEMIAKSSVDPGSSALLHELLNVDQGMTQYSVVYTGLQPVKVKYLFPWLKQCHDATLVGVLPRQGQPLAINPHLEVDISAGATIYYIADERINNVQWEALDAFCETE